jgi:hypothetical protein
MSHTPQHSAFWEMLRDGSKLDCPCCGRHSQVYRRCIHQSVALQLIELYNLGERRGRHFVHASLLIPKGSTGVGDIGKAAYWGLIEKMQHAPGARKSSGLWRMTGLGCDFVEQKTVIMRTALVFNDSVIGFEGPRVDIVACSKQKYDYTETIKEGV